MGNLGEVIETLLVTALPGLFGGAPPPVGLSIHADAFEVDPLSADQLASEPRPDDRTDEFPFDPADPPAPFTLTQPPYLGPRRVRLTTALGDRIPLQENEVLWDETDPRVFSLDLRPSRDLSGVDGVQVLYGVTAMFTMLNVNQTLTVQMQSTQAAQLAQAEALAIGVIELNRQEVVDAAAVTYSGGDYSAAVTVKSLKLLQGSSPGVDERHLTYHAEIELKATRALAVDEGKPITRIRTPGRPLDPDRAVDVYIQVDA